MFMELVNCHMHKEFLEKIYDADSRNQTKKSLDYIFEWFDDQFEKKNYFECEVLISEIDIEKLSTRSLLGVLSITLNLKTVLATRASFLERVHHKLQRERPDDVERLMQGL